MSSAYEVGKKLVELCKAGRFGQAIDTLYSQDIVSIEPQGTPQSPARMEGLAKVKAKTEWWEKNHQMHSGEVRGPWTNGDRFVVYFNFDVTAKSGPMAGKRMRIEETGLYTVKNGKITHEEFFYQMGPDA